MTTAWPGRQLPVHHRQRNKRRFSRGPQASRPVSVIVPAYHERECFADTVHSLAASTHPIEIIVVDDGSPDGTAEIVEALGRPSSGRYPPSGRGCRSGASGSCSRGAGC
ncbi:glycosyltransferase [Streptomyces sp. VRA16 Mangrove soil]|nr:glycosyltransferase [Streptomyces sp. VRA16 Mangrove soil]